MLRRRGGIQSFPQWTVARGSQQFGIIVKRELFHRGVTYFPVALFLIFKFVGGRKSKKWQTQVN